MAVELLQLLLSRWLSYSNMTHTHIQNSRKTTI